MFVYYLLFYIIFNIYCMFDTVGDGASSVSFRVDQYWCWLSINAKNLYYVNIQVK